MPAGKKTEREKRRTKEWLYISDSLRTSYICTPLSVFYVVDELQVLLASKLDVPVQQVMISQVKVSERSKASRVVVLHCSKVYTHYWGGGRKCQ